MNLRIRNTLVFKTCCLGNYKYKHNLNEKEAMQIFDRYGIFQYLADFYAILHTCGINYIIDDIETYISNRKA